MGLGPWNGGSRMGLKDFSLFIQKIQSLSTHPLELMYKLSLACISQSFSLFIRRRRRCVNGKFLYISCISIRLFGSRWMKMK